MRSMPSEMGLLSCSGKTKAVGNQWCRIVSNDVTSFVPLQAVQLSSYRFFILFHQTPSSSFKQFLLGLFHCSISLPCFQAVLLYPHTPSFICVGSIAPSFNVFFVLFSLLIFGPFCHTPAVGGTIALSPHPRPQTKSRPTRNMLCCSSMHST